MLTIDMQFMLDEEKL